MSYTPKAREALSGRVNAEPLCSETEAKRKNLIFTACFSILLTVYGVRVMKLPWLEFEVPEGAPSIVQGALSVALFYTFLVFAFHALADLRRWFNAGDQLYLGTYFDLALNTQNHLHAVTQWLEKPLPADADQRASVESMFRSAEVFLTELSSAVTAAKRGHRKLSAIQLIRLVTVDLGVSLGLGLFAMAKMAPALWPFLSVVAS